MLRANILRSLCLIVVLILVSAGCLSKESFMSQAPKISELSTTEAESAYTQQDMKSGRSKLVQFFSLPNDKLRRGY